MESVSQLEIFQKVRRFEEKSVQLFGNLEGLTIEFEKHPSIDVICASVGWVYYEGLERNYVLDELQEVGFLMLGWVLQKKKSALLLKDNGVYHIESVGKKNLKIQDVLEVVDFEEEALGEEIEFPRQLELIYDKYLLLP